MLCKSTLVLCLEPTNYVYSCLHLTTYSHWRSWYAWIAKSPSAILSIVRSGLGLVLSRRILTTLLVVLSMQLIVPVVHVWLVTGLRTSIFISYIPLLSPTVFHLVNISANTSRHGHGGLSFRYSKYPFCIWYLKHVGCYWC